MHVIRTAAMNVQRSIRSRLATAVIGVGLLCAAVTPATAQFGGRGGMATLFVPDYLPRDLPVFVDSLSLEEWQRPILEALLEDYNTNFNTAADGVRAKMGQFKDAAAGASPEKVVEMITRPLMEWASEKKKLQNDFLASVKSQLSDVQSESWPRLQRALRREKSLPNGELSGESLNLLLLAREIDASPLALDAARVAMDEYELKLDEALAARDAEVDATITPLLQAMSTNDAQRGVAAQERIMQRRIAVRAVQDSGITAISTAFGGDLGHNFEKRALKRAFPPVYGPDPVNPLFEAAQALSDLSVEQKSKIAALKTQFDSEHGALQTRYVEAIRQSEPTEPRRRTDLAAKKAAGGTIKYTDAPEVEKIKDERQDLFSRYRAMLAEILTDSQKDAVPGFGKPGAAGADGGKYNAAVHAGSGAGANPSNGKLGGVKAAQDTMDPNVKPRTPQQPSMNDTAPTGAQPAPNPKKSVD
jgi:hypothetical protein